MTQLHEGSSAVQAHLQMSQSVIQRMASNCASCKAWCVGLVSATLVVVADKGKPDYILIAVIPTILFLILDAYYLALEKRFRSSYNSFIHKLHGGHIAAEDLYCMEPAGKACRSFFAALTSFSVWPLYLTLLGMIFLTKHLVRP
jgi:hypothetical protein